MADDDVTPVVSILDIARKDCDRKRERCKAELDAKLERIDQRLDKKHDQLMVLVGPDGKNGRVGQMRNDVDRLDAEQAKTKALLIKMLIIMASSSALGAGASHALLKLL